MTEYVVHIKRDGSHVDATCMTGKDLGVHVGHVDRSPSLGTAFREIAGYIDRFEKRGSGNGSKEAVIEAWTDGSGDTRPPKIGGWSAIVKLPGSPFMQELSGAAPGTTSQRMEMTAVIEMLKHFTEPRHFIIHCDSAYVVNCFADNWIAGWRRRGWLTSKGSIVANRDLWEKLEAEMNKHHSVKFIKVAGHAGHEHNERADKLAGEARRKYRDTFK